MTRCEFLFREGRRCQRAAGHYPPQPHSWELAAEELIAAARRERDADWREALEMSHYDSIDGLHDECADCAPLRALLCGFTEDAAEPPKEASKELK